MTLLDPVTHALAALLAATHAGLASLGADPDSAATWLLCLLATVVVVRTALLPFTIHAVRAAHSSARARPQMRALTEKYRGRRDAESLRSMLTEKRNIAAEHGTSRLGCLPLVLQLPVWFALFRLVSDVAAGQAVGAMNATLAASLGGATVLGVSLAERGYAVTGPAHLGLVSGLAIVAAAVSYASQRFFVAPNTDLEGMPDTMVRAQELLPALSAVGLLAAAGMVPVALLAYWVCNGVWTLLQSAVVWRWFPTPGSPAAQRHVST